MKEELLELEGRVVTVSVSTGGIVRNDFRTQMSIKGILETLDGESFRVLVNNCTYCYFETEDVYLINPLVSTGVVIHLRIDTPKEEDL
tara:strand:- start:33 stop:296 length:264 start_codon:yes stop_codon:yes gene_type:complete